MWMLRDYLRDPIYSAPRLRVFTSGVRLLAHLIYCVGDGPRLQALKRDWFSGLLAEAMGAVVEAAERPVNLGD